MPKSIFYSTFFCSRLSWCCFQLLCLCLFVFPLSGKAQKSFYIEAGMNVSKLSPLFKGYTEINFYASPQVSLNWRRSLYRNTVYYHFGIGYQRIGEKMKSDNSRKVRTTLYSYYLRNVPEDFGYTIQVHQLKLPIKVEFKWMNFQFLSGLYLSKTLVGKMDYSHHVLVDGSPKGKYKLIPGRPYFPSPDIPQDEDMIRIKQYTYGYSLGIAYKIDRFGVLLNYEQGLIELDHCDQPEYSAFRSYEVSIFDKRYSFEMEDGRLKQHTISLTLLYYFGNGHLY